MIGAAGTALRVTKHRRSSQGGSRLVIVYRGGKRPLAPTHPASFLDNSIIRNYDGRKRRNSDGCH
jgi:hypothetical protein